MWDISKAKTSLRIENTTSFVASRVPSDMINPSRSAKHKQASPIAPKKKKTRAKKKKKLGRGGAGGRKHKRTKATKKDGTRRLNGNFEGSTAARSEPIHPEKYTAFLPVQTNTKTAHQSRRVQSLLRRPQTDGGAIAGACIPWGRCPTAPPPGR
jgi:hypothetical protein